MANYVFPKVDEVKPPHSKRDLSLYKQATFSAGPLYPILSIDTLPDDWMKIRTVAALESLPMLGPVRGRWKLSFDYYFEPWSNLYGYMDNNNKMSTDSIIDEYLWNIPIGGSSLGYDNPSEYTNSIKLLDFVRDLRVNGKSSVLDYLGVPVGYFGDVKKNESEDFFVYPKAYNASGFLTYLDIVRNYYVNNQEMSAPFIMASKELDEGEGTDVLVNGPYGHIELSYLDDYFAQLRYDSRNGLTSVDTAIIPDVDNFEPIFDFDSNRVTYGIGKILLSAQQRQTVVASDGLRTDILRNVPNCGLFLRSYRMDLMRGIMNNSVGQYKSIVDTSAGNFDVTTLMFANKLQTLINRIDITGGRFTDWIRTRWGVKPNIEVDRPIYLGSHSTWLDTIDVVASASGTNGDSDNGNSSSYLGQQVSYGQGQLGASDQRPVICSMKQYGTLQCVMSLVPDVVYSQGFELNTLKTKFMDLFDPAFNQLGYQDVLRLEQSAFPAGYFTPDGKEFATFETDTDYSVGKRVAWSEYMASLPRAHGDFAYGESLDWWTNGRKYSTESEYPVDADSVIDSIYDANPQITSKDGIALAINVLRKCGGYDTTTYIYPHLYNNIFAQQDAYSLNWIISVRFDIEANRALGKRLMPHL